MTTITLKISAKAAAQMVDANINTAMIIDTLVSTKKTVSPARQKKVMFVKAMSKSQQMIQLVLRVNNRSNNHMTVEAVSNRKTATKAKAFDMQITLSDSTLDALYQKKKK